MIDHYCERTGPGLLNEPLNAVTNLAFLTAAVMAARYASKARALSYPVQLLIVLLAFVGVGSGLFHTFATEWSRWADIIPIFLFQTAFLWCYGRHVLGFAEGSMSVLLAVYITLLVYCSTFSGVLNGSLIYLPGLAAIFVLALAENRVNVRLPGLLLAAGALFALSLLFRTIDMQLCPLVPSGTHFIWHILNAVVLYILIRSLVFHFRE
jgi:hypothetical protein